MEIAFTGMSGMPGEELRSLSGIGGAAGRTNFGTTAGTGGAAGRAELVPGRRQPSEEGTVSEEDLPEEVGKRPLPETGPQLEPRQ